MGTSFSHSRRRRAVVALLATAALLVTACVELKPAERQLSYPNPMLNADFGNRAIAQTDYDPFGWAGHGEEGPVAVAALTPAPAVADAAPTHAATAPEPKKERRASAVVSPTPNELSVLDDGPSGDSYDPIRSAEFVTAVYEVNGVNLKAASRDKSSQPSIIDIYRHVYRQGVLYHSGDPATGDVVFFHNTFDRNDDGRFNDWYTLVGVVESVDEIGTVTALAYVEGKVQRLLVNTSHPTSLDVDGETVNNLLRSDSLPPDQTGAAGQLFAGYGSLLGNAERVVVIDNWQPGMLTASR